MTTSTTSRIACVFAGAAMLSACGGSQLSIAPPVVQQAVTRSKTFVFTGKPQTFTVPSGVTQIAVAAYGAGSPSENQGPTGPIATGANGGLLKATIPVKPREKLAIFVGGQGGISVGGSRASGGFNGGAPGGRGIYHDQYADGGFGGGGASDVREGGSGLKNRVLIAAGAGGGGVGVGFYGGGAAGGGGGILGLAGGSGCLCGGPTGYGALGGSQTSGGHGGAGGNRSGFNPGANGRNGKLGRGGAGGGDTQYSGGGGGGGGGGYYGGGGGGAGSWSTSGVGGGGGGGGGSSYVEPGATHVKDVTGGAGAGNGKIVISW